MRVSVRAAALVAIVAIVVIFGFDAVQAQPTLTTITIDGNMGDWATVLANPVNVIYDGPGGGLADADAPVATDRDVDTIAYTWDGTYLYFYVHRQKISSQGRHFWFYIDADNDGSVATGEPLLRIAWPGTTRITTRYVDTYQATVGGAGDPVSGGAGHDGYTMPGSRSAGPLLEQGIGGSTSGLEMETRVPWALLGVGPGVGLQFHMATSSSTAGFPNSIKDNTGGTIAPLAPVMTLLKAVDKASAIPLEVLTYTVNYTNTGSADALMVKILDPVPANTTFIASSATGAGMTIEYSHDGGSTFDSLDTAPVTHIRWTWPGNLTPGAGGGVGYQVTID